MLSGTLMIGMGLMKLGNLVRFVSFSVMTGFLAGIAILAILSQLPTLFAISAEGSNKILQTVNLFQQMDRTNWHALLPGVATIVFMVLLPKTPSGPEISDCFGCPAIAFYLFDELGRCRSRERCRSPAKRVAPAAPAQFFTDAAISFQRGAFPGVDYTHPGRRR